MARKASIRVVLDTNWYVSATINKNSRRTLYNILKDRRITVYYSTELMLEYRAVLDRAKFRKYVSNIQVMRFVSLILIHLKRIEIKSQTSLSKDADDNYILSMCKDCKADFLVTGDPHLLAISKFEKTRILTMTQFLSYLE